jgi:MFS transporter, PPP family, 3-phenylpropionic acid transporter
VGPDFLSNRVRAALAYFFLFGGLGALFPYAPLYYLGRGVSYADMGLIFSLGSLIGIVAGPAWGALSDRAAGSPRVLLLTCIVSVAGVALLALATTFPAILVSNLVLGVGLAGLLPIIDARAIEAAGTERAGFGPLRAWGSIGWVASSLLTGLAIEAWGLGVMFIVLAGGLLMTAVLGIGLTPIARVRAQRALWAAGRVFRTPALLLFLLGMFLAAGAMSAALDFFSPRYQELRASAGIIGFSSALAAAIEVPIMLRFPRLARRFGGAGLLLAGAVIIALRSGLAALATDPAFLVAASGIGGIGYALFFVGGVTHVAEHVPPHLAATGQGIFQGVAFGLSGVLAAAAAGVLAGAIGIAGMFGIAATVGGVAVLVIAAGVLPGSKKRELAFAESAKESSRPDTITR